MAGYSGTPLVKKLGIKDGFLCHRFQAPAHYDDLLGELPAGARFTARLGGELDFIHAFFEDARSFRAALPRLKAALRSSGALWISWRKGKVTDLTEDAVRDHALAAGLVDVKVCAVDDTWSGLKLVYRLRDRK
jgi:hypothetical protein